MRSIVKLFIIGLLVTTMNVSSALTLADKGGNGGGHGGWHGKAFGHGPKGHGKGHAVKANHGGASQLAKANKAARFSATNKATITRYFQQNPFPATALPPGIAMNLARGKPLPPGIAKRFLPSALTEQLPVYPGYEYVAVGKDVVLVNSSTGLVSDILSNVLH